MDLLPDNNSPNSPSSLSPSTAVAASVSAPSSSSRSSSRSPSGSFDPLPTPQHDPINAFDISGMNLDGSLFANGGLSTIDEESMFNFGYGATGNDFFKPGTDPIASLSQVSYDLFGSFDGLSGAVAASPESASASSSTSTSSAVKSPVNVTSGAAIDPYLVGTSGVPAAPPPLSEGSAESESTNKEHEAGSEVEQDLLVIPPIKVGGKGAARKGTLHSGGITKKSSIGPQSIFGALAAASGDKPVSSVVASAKSGSGKSKGKSGGKDMDDDNDSDADDWRPSPEEYQKMSSKEKRQLRNKISARNFRIRRKGKW